MEGSRHTLKYICIGLGAVVVVLLIVVAFLLGKNSGAGSNSGAGRDSSDGAAVTKAVDTAELTGDAATGSSQSAADSEDDASGSGGSSADASEQSAATTASTAAVQAEGMPATLDIDMSNGSLTFEKGSTFGVKYDSSVIRVQQNGSSMTIANDHSSPSAAERKLMDVVVTVPDGAAFSQLDITFGAGKLISYTLPATELRLELGAGSATLENVVVTGSATVKSGAGAFAIKSGAIANLNLQCGAGATQVQAALTGSSSITAAVGAADLRLEGKESDYTVSFNMSLGACYFNDSKISRSGTYGSGPNKVDINGGLGVMRVNIG